MNILTGRIAQALALVLTLALPSAASAQLTMPPPTMPPGETTPPPVVNPMSGQIADAEMQETKIKTLAQKLVTRLSSIIFASRNRRFPLEVRNELKKYITAIKASLAVAREEGDLAREALTEVQTLAQDGNIISAALKLLEALSHLNKATAALAEAEENLKAAEEYLKEMDKKYPLMPEEPMPEPAPMPDPAPMPTSSTNIDMQDGGTILQLEDGGPILQLEDGGPILQ